MNKILLTVVALSLVGCSKPNTYNGDYVECKAGVLYYSGSRYLTPVFNKEGKVVLCGDQHE